MMLCPMTLGIQLQVGTATALTKTLVTTVFVFPCESVVLAEN